METQDEWKNLEDIIANKLKPLCKKMGYNENQLLLDYMIKYSELNCEYNIANKRYLSSDVVPADVSINNAKLAATHVENVYFTNYIRRKNDVDIY